MAHWHDAYRKRYARLKEAGKPFFPYAVVKDCLAAFLIFGVLCFLAWKFGAELQDLADPTDAAYNPRPEWYFLFLFQALKAFPGRMEAVAAVFLPGAAVLVLLLLPFLDRGPKRHPLDRPFWTLLGVLTLTSIGYLTWAGYKSPLVNPVVKRYPLVLAGSRIYQELNCAYCHKIGGKGGGLGPELDKLSGEEAAWLEKHFRDPGVASPGSVMPKMNLLDDEIKALGAYIESLGGAGPYTEEAPKLFAEHCAACHRFGKEGGEVGPDLSMIGTARNKFYIKQYILDPSGLNPAAGMPGFKGQLAETQSEDIARYLTWSGSKSPETHPLVKMDPEVRAGLRLYRDLNCSYCHKIGGIGGEIGPELDETAPLRDVFRLKRHFRDPKAASPGSVMPKLGLSDPEIKVLVAYMKSLGGEALRKQGARLFEDNCMACHRFGKVAGGARGPDLAVVVRALNKAHIRQYILDPLRLNLDAKMLGFQSRLTGRQIDSLLSYLTGGDQGRENKKNK